MKSNHIPRGLIPLESLFDQNDVARDLKVELAVDAIEDKNIGTESNPKIISFPRNFPLKKKKGM